MTISAMELEQRMAAVVSLLRIVILEGTQPVMGRTLPAMTQESAARLTSTTRSLAAKTTCSSVSMDKVRGDDQSHTNKLCHRSRQVWQLAWIDNILGGMLKVFFLWRDFRVSLKGQTLSASMFALRLDCSIAALTTPQKVLPIWLLVELKMLDFSDPTSNGISILPTATYAAQGLLS